MNYLKTVSDLELELGAHLRDLRLRLNIDQRLLAEQAGVALNVVKNLESGKGSTITSLIKILRILGRTDWLENVAPTASISPLQMLKTKHVRQRASRRKGTSNV